jgi:hypothetical protein
MDENNSIDKHEKLIDLLNRLANEKRLDKLEQEEEKIGQYIDEFRVIYSQEFRHIYSKVHSILVNLDEQQRIFLGDSIKTIYDKICKEEKSESEVAKSILKLWDHIELENMRIAELSSYVARAEKGYNKIEGYSEKIDQFSQKINDISEQIVKAQDDLGTTTDNIKEVEDKVRNSTIQSITVLSIFSGIVMAFSGGVSFIASSMQNINSISKYRLVFVVLLLGMIMFNTIFLLIYMIGKITNTYVGSRCKHSIPLQGCKEKAFKCAFIRYPFICWMNFVLLLGMVGLYILHICERFILPKNIDGLYNSPLKVIIPIVVVIIGVLALGYWAFTYIFSIKCSYKEPNMLERIQNSFKNFLR